MNMKKGVELLLDLPGQEITIATDPTRLSQVINNLVNNAIKFTSEGSIRVGYKQKGEELEFYVQDTGVGIDAESQAHIFERFVKLNSFVHGTGLGLSIAKEIVDRHEGTIRLVDRPGPGLTVRMELPVGGPSHV